ncbi:MAG: hypothetical protein ABSG80_10140 [Verrucomicrobiota bacterium]|jgi:hypothetical protein
MPQNAFGPLESRDEIEVILDGLPVGLPSGRRSLSAIRCHLETLALESHRILYSLSVDGQPVNLALPLLNQRIFCRVEAGTVALEETSLLLLKKAFQQTDLARECVETALTLVLINDGRVAHEVWWNLASVLKEPVITLSLLPENTCEPFDNRTSLAQLRKWQLEQIAAIIRDVNEACHSEDTIPLSNALENRVLPWLQSLSELISLWHETALAGSRLGISSAVS